MVIRVLPVILFLTLIAYSSSLSVSQISSDYEVVDAF